MIGGHECFSLRRAVKFTTMAAMLLGVSTQAHASSAKCRARPSIVCGHDPFGFDTSLAFRQRSLRFGPLHTDDLPLTFGAGILVLALLEFLKSRRLKVVD